MTRTGASTGFISTSTSTWLSAPSNAGEYPQKIRQTLSSDRIGVSQGRSFCEARRASHCHSPQTTFSSNSTCCVLSTQKSAMHVVVYADRLTTQHSIVDIVYWSWSYWQFCYPRWHVECFWAALAAHWISSASHTSVLPQHPRRKIVPYRVGWNHHTSDYCG